MHVPRLDADELVTRREPGPCDDADQPHARLNQSPPQEQILPERMPAITIAHGRGLLFDIECLPSGRTLQQIESRLPKAFERVLRVGLSCRCVLLAKLFQQTS